LGGHKAIFFAAAPTSSTTEVSPPIVNLIFTHIDFVLTMSGIEDEETKRRYYDIIQLGLSQKQKPSLLADPLSDEDSPKNTCSLSL
jgi:hypothetical protein